MRIFGSHSFPLQSCEPVLRTMPLIRSLARADDVSYIAMSSPTTHAMVATKENVTVIDTGSPEGKAWAEKLGREIEEGKARVRRHGGTSFEGFYIGEDGKPHSIGEDD